MGHTVILSLMTVLLGTVHDTDHAVRQLAKELFQYTKKKKKNQSRQPEISLNSVFYFCDCYTLTQCTLE